MTARVARIMRHPIKGHGREDLAATTLTPGQSLPHDRRWAVALDTARLVEGWNPCVNFARGAKTAALMAINATLDEDAGRITLRHPDLPDHGFRPDDPADLPGFLRWLAPLNPPDRAQPTRIVAAGRAMTDTPFPSVSILSLASNADLSARMGRDLSPLRWRGNLWIEGTEPWAEWDWIGRTIRIGEALLKIEERITRCSATTVDPATGISDADTLGALDAAFGHRDFGVYASVVQGGRVATGDAAVLLA